MSKDNKFRREPLRSFASPSYDPETGHAASAFDNYGSSFTADGIRVSPKSQREAGRTKGEGGARGFDECDRERTQGSRTHSQKWGGSSTKAVK